MRLDRFDPARDSELLHAWVTEERARFWMMAERSLEEVRDIYTWLDQQPTHHVWLVRDAEGRPLALFQDYQPTAEEVGDHYDVRPGDLGVHFMLAPGQPPGTSGGVIGFLLRHAFADPQVQRLVVEPDARNDKAVALVRRLGFELGPVVQLSTKPAQLAFLGRPAYDELASAFSKNASA